MIQTLFITIVPMLFAAAILMVGGIQLSKKSVTEITPHDKERLLSFSYLFQTELSRLDKLYLAHLNDLSQLHDKVNQTALHTQTGLLHKGEDLFELSFVVYGSELFARQAAGPLALPLAVIGDSL